MVYSAAVLTQSSGTTDAATRIFGDSTASSAAAWYSGDLLLVTGNLDQGYDPTKPSANLPSGAIITPGDPNYVPGGNVAPSNTVPGAQIVNEDTVLSFTAANTISVTDTDGNLTTTRLTVKMGTLAISLAGGAIISSGVNGTSTLTLSGTETQINAALATLSY